MFFDAQGCTPVATSVTVATKFESARGKYSSNVSSWFAFGRCTSLVIRTAYVHTLRRKALTGFCVLLCKITNYIITQNHGQYHEVIMSRGKISTRH